MEERHLINLTNAVELIEEVATEIQMGSPEWNALVGVLADLDEIVKPHNE